MTARKQYVRPLVPVVILRPVLEPARVHAVTYTYRTPRPAGMVPFARLTR